MERDQAIKFVLDLLKMMIAKEGSDMFVTVGFPPAIKIHGQVTPVTKTPLKPEDTKAMVYAVMRDKQLKEFEATNECNFAISPPGIGRFRANAFVQQGYMGMILRTITSDVPTLDGLGLPEVIKDISLTKRGLVIMVGGTGSGKSTSMAAMINHRNENQAGHIITLEDPIEYVHPHKKCIVTQREIGLDSESWEVALKNTLRQTPDVILMGEIRDAESMEHAIAFAETGHLCVATLHANSSNQALDRVINFFSEERRSQLLMDMSLNIKAVIAQRLLKTPDGKGRSAAIEIMINSPLIADLILKGEIHMIKEIMGKSREIGMVTFDQALFELLEADKVTMDEALKNADSANELRLKVKLEGKAAKGTDALGGLDHLSLEDEEEEDQGQGMF
ncbi:MAG: PilT/PilU family type 4a pilus ATPase [Gammaproteobacteria bacterium]|nr:PilT/PilU family type 4a pilus ATPase [Gammaproteobacteria bacterium]